MAGAAAGAVVLRFPLERRLAAIRADRKREEASEALATRAVAGRPVPVPGGEQLKLGSGVDCTYVFNAGFFGVRLRPATT